MFSTMKWNFTILVICVTNFLFSQNVINGNFQLGNNVWLNGEIRTASQFYPGGNPTNWMAEIDLGSSPNQIINGFTVGRCYKISFDAQRRPLSDCIGGAPPMPSQFSVIIDNGALNAVVTCTETSAGMSNYTFNFTATSTSHLLMFAPFGAMVNTSCGALIDNVVIIPYNIPVQISTTATSVCQYETTPVVEFTVTSSDPPPFVFTYTINNGPIQTLSSSNTSNTASLAISTQFAATNTVQLVSVYNQNLGCSSPLNEQIQIIVRPEPVIVNQNLEICLGDTAVINVDSNFDYNIAANPTLLTGNGVFPALVNPVSNQYYTLIGTDVFGCSGEGQIFVQVNDLPNVNGGPDQFVCSGDEIALSASGADIYFWNPSIQNNSPFQVFQSTNFEVEGIASNGCSTVDMVSVFVYETPTLLVTDTLKVCPGGLIALEANGSAATYIWSNQIPNGNSFEPLSSGYIEVTGTSANGCTITDSVYVFIQPILEGTISQNVVVCQNAASPIVEFTSNNGISPYTFMYTINNGPVQTIVSNLNTTSINVSTTQPGIYNYTLTGLVDSNPLQCNQALNLTTTVTVNPIPTASLSGGATLCQGDVEPNLVFVGSLGSSPYSFTYSLNNGSPQTIISTNDTATIDVSTQFPGTFVYTLLNVSDASSSQCGQVLSETETIIINTLPEANITGGGVVCLGSTAPEIIFTGSNGIEPYTFYYMINNGPIQSVVSNSNQGVIYPPSNNAGSWIYTLLSVTDGSVQSCSQNQAGSSIITVNSLPEATISGDNTVCVNENSPDVVMTGFNGTPPYNFVYSINNGLPQTITSTNGLNNASISIGTSQAGNYVVELLSVFDSSNPSCNQTIDSYVTINVNPIPEIIVSESVSGCSILNGNIEISTTTPAAYCNWQISNGMSGFDCNEISFEIENPGCYDLNISTQDINGCASSLFLPDYICVYPNPIASFNTLDNNLHSYSTNAVFVNQSEGASSYWWDFGDGENSTEVNPEHHFVDDIGGKYRITLVAMNEFNCVDTAYDFITISEDLIFYVPNAFTPDGDNFNQEFKPVFSSGYDPYDYLLSIYNRWGELIFESKDVEFGWDGKYNFDLSQDGVYTWKIEVGSRSNGKMNRYVGHFTLLK